MLGSLKSAQNTLKKLNQQLGNMTKVLNAGLVIAVREQEIKKVIYDVQISEKVYTLVKTWIDGELISEIVLNSAGYNITTPSIAEMLEEIIEESK